MDDFLGNALRGLGIRALFLIVCAGGLAVAFLRWRRHPRTSLLAAIGCGVLLVSSLGTVVVYDFVSLAINRWQWPMEHASMLFTATSFVAFTVDAVGVGLLLAAVFRGRGAAGGPAA